MTPSFLLLAAIAVSIALFFILLPLLRAANPERARIERQINALDDLIDELDPTEYARQRKALRARLNEEGGPRGTSLGLIAALVLIVPLGTALLYTGVGAPEGLGTDGTPTAELRAELVRIANSLERNPNDAEQWTRLGLAYKNIQEFSSAAHALRRALYIDDSNPFVKVELAETLMFMSQAGSMPGESRQLLVEALTLDPEQQKALWLMGVGAFQEGQYPRAIAFWERLLGQLDPASGVYNSIRGQIAQAQVALGQDPGELPPARTAPPLGAGQTALPPGHPPMDAPARTAGPIPPGAVAPPGHPTTTRPGPVDPTAALPPGHPPMDAPARTAGPIDPTAAVPPGHPPMDAPARSAGAAEPTAEPAPSFGVEVRLSDELTAGLQGNETVFIVARAANGPPTPLAVRRLTVADLPARINLSDNDAMVEGMTLSTFGDIIITARVSMSGGVEPRPGDLEGRTPPTSIFETPNTTLTITTRLP